MSIEEKAAGLAIVIADFRRSEGVNLDVDSVLRWVYQFEDEHREALIECMHRLLLTTYASENYCRQLLQRMLDSPHLTNGNPLEYWSSTYVIRDQGRGDSQRRLVDIFGELARTRFGDDFVFGNHLSNRSFYLDDYIFTGGRVKEDFTRWIDRVRHYDGRFHLDMGFFGAHSLGEYYFDTFVSSTYSDLGSRITYKVRKFRTFENRRARRNSSQVFWPSINALSIGYPAFDYGAPVLRSPPGAVERYWSEQDRALLERTLLTAGCRIADSCAVRTPSMRPLGYYNLGYGFGATCVSYLNCPNNAPLALWWSARTQGLPQGWHPLMPRRTND